MLCDLDPKVEVIGKKAGICDGVPSTAALVFDIFVLTYSFGLQKNQSLLFYLKYIVLTEPLNNPTPNFKKYDQEIRQSHTEDQPKAC